MDNGTDRPEPRPDNRDKMGLPGGAVADSCDFQEGLSNGGLKALILEQTGHSLPLDDPRLIRHSGNVEQLAAYGLRPAA